MAAKRKGQHLHLGSSRITNSDHILHPSPYHTHSRTHTYIIALGVRLLGRFIISVTRCPVVKMKGQKYCEDEEGKRDYGDMEAATLVPRLISDLISCLKFGLFSSLPVFYPPPPTTSPTVFPPFCSFAQTPRLFAWPGWWEAEVVVELGCGRKFGATWSDG